MKRLFTVGCLLFLTACAATDSSAMKFRYEQAIQDANTQELSDYLTMNRELFSYYLSPHIGRVNSTANSVHLKSHNESIMMLLDVVSILRDSDNDKLRTLIQSYQSFYSEESQFIDQNKAVTDYRIDAFKINDKLVMLLLQTKDIIMTSVHPNAVSSTVLYDMVRIARSVVVNEDAVILVYSNQEVIDYQKTNLNMFAQTAPLSGTVLDMIKEIESMDFDAGADAGYDEQLDEVYLDEDIELNMAEME